MELENCGNNSNTQYGVEKLVGTNYKYWRNFFKAKICRIWLQEHIQTFRRMLKLGGNGRSNVENLSLHCGLPLARSRADQPSVEELKSLLSNQEALAKQMTKSLDPEAVLFSKGKHYKKYAYHKSNK
ncbi:hypothetical protein V6N11_080534 [Hibiscus sabdariffa]|uniref:Uncharacterized protein n=1 Tax=Hibiscus sabdariffa TaxID=183260 RepID=A0ABR2R818_9ROSI